MSLFKNKKGAALPLAIFFMTFCLLFSTLVVLVSLRVYTSKKTYEEIYDKEINNKFVFDQMGEAFFRSVEDHKTEEDIKSAVIAASGYSEEKFPYDIRLMYFSNLNSVKSKFKIDDKTNLIDEIQSKLNTEKKATSTFGVIVQNTVNGVKNTVSKIQTGVKTIWTVIQGEELQREPTLEDLLQEYNKSLTGLKSQYEIKLMHKGTDDLVLDVAIGVEYVEGNSAGVGEQGSAYADLSEKYRVLNWSNREIDEANLPEGFDQLEAVFESKNDTVIVGKEVGVDYDNLLIVRVVNGIIDLFR